jgi:peptide/nickel transport system permease protein
MAEARTPRAAIRRSSRWAPWVRSLRRDRIVLIALVILALAIFAAVAGPWITPYAPTAQDLGNRLVPPLSPRPGVSVLGSDALGRDILSRIIAGARVSLAVAAAAVLVSGVIGVVLGVIAGMSRGWLGALIMRLADVQFSIPYLILALALVAVVGPGLLNIIVVLGVSGWVPYARTTRAQVLYVKELDFVEASRSVGSSDLRIALRHILPHALGVVGVIATIESARVIITEASLSFLGLGVPIGTPTWGVMIADGRNYLGTAWWVSALPGIAIVITVVALNIVGDWLSDYANPVLRDR